MPTRRSKRKNFQKQGSAVMELPKLHPNAAGIDIGTEELWVAVPPDRSTPSIRMFYSFTNQLQELVRWLKECRIDTVAIESTGVLWIPLFQILSDGGIEVFLVNARHYQNVPGRRTDVQDCQWLQYLHSVGLVRSSFLPSQAVRALRTLVRHREDLIKMAAQHIQHIHKTLDQMNLKLHYVISDITGATGQRILDAILEGKRDPEELASLRDRRIRASAEQVRESLVGDYRPEYLFTLRQSLEIWRDYQKRITTADEEMEGYMARLAPEGIQAAPQMSSRLRSAKVIRQEKIRIYCLRAFGVDLTGVPSVGTGIMLTLASELGPDFSKIPSGADLASLLGLCPNHEITGGKVVSRHTKKTTNRLASALRMAVESLQWDKSALGDWFRRIKARLGPAQANTAGAHKIARIIYSLVTNKQEYDDRRFANDHRPDMQRKRARLERTARSMGYQLVPIPT